MQVAEWRLLQRLPTLTLSQLNTDFEALLHNKQGSALLYQKLIERCTELSGNSEENEVGKSVELMTRVKAGEEKGHFYAKTLPKVMEMVRKGPGDRAARLVVAYAAEGVESAALYQLANTALKPVAAQLAPDLAVKLANWLAPYLQLLPEASTFYPELETIPLQSPSQAVSMLQGFVKAHKGSYSFLSSISARIFSEQQALSGQLQSAAIHYICKSGLQDASIFAALETMAEQLDLSLMIGNAFDLASAGHQPHRLLSTVKARAQELEDVRDLISLQWVYQLGGEPLPKELETVKSFLLLNGLHVSSYLLGRRLSTLSLSQQPHQH
jgi:hypothetical protein